MERFDYYYPEFNGLTDQGIKRSEIYCTGDSEHDQQIFGYIGRYDEYRFFNNEICGELRSTYNRTLDSWHYAEKFENSPNLSGQFIEDKTDEIIKRTLAIQKDGNELAEQFIIDIEYEGSVIRVLPSKAIPRTGGRIL